MERIWVWGTGGPYLLMEKRYIDLWEADAGTQEQELYYKTGEVDGELYLFPACDLKPGSSDSG
ncbi:MAG: hypothetical protein HFG58_03460 [Lachnospiraceae bacterium]|jgi:hypothetical protein|nr:hypothetical protein [Lachnospiraceae bacterium]